MADAYAEALTARLIASAKVKTASDAQRLASDLRQAELHANNVGKAVADLLCVDECKDSYEITSAGVIVYGDDGRFVIVDPPLWLGVSGVTAFLRGALAAVDELRE